MESGTATRTRSERFRSILSLYRAFSFVASWAKFVSKTRQHLTSPSWSTWIVLPLFLLLTMPTRSPLRSSSIFSSFFRKRIAKGKGFVEFFYYYDSMYVVSTVGAFNAFRTLESSKAHGSLNAVPLTCGT